MDATAGFTASGGGSLSMPSSRKEWRAISDHHSVQNAGDELPMEQSKFGQSDERTIYEHGIEPVDIDFCFINAKWGLDNEILQQRIHSVARRREELQQMEINLNTQLIVRSEMTEMQKCFDAQVKEHEGAAAKLQEQLHEKEETIHVLERRMEEKDRELHAFKLDNEAACAKEDLLREQNKELATFRRERDHSEVERAEHLQQIRDLQDRIQEKECQILELQEQHRADQETIYLKDEQLKVWIARVQEMDALKSTTNHSLQAELREHSEQYNQLWSGCQRQFVEMERLHLHAIQQLQIELADARERSGSYPDESHVSQTNSKDVSKFGQSIRNQKDVNGMDVSNINNRALPKGNTDAYSSFASFGNAPNQANHVAGVPIAPSLLGVPTYLPPGLYPYILQQQGIPHSMPSHGPQSHVRHFQPVQALSSQPQWQNQQVLESTDRKYLVVPQSDQCLQHISSQFDDVLRLNLVEQKSEKKGQNVMKLSNQGIEGEVLVEDQPTSYASASLFETSVLSVNHSEATISNNTDVVSSEAFISNGQTIMVTAGRTVETALLDERSLLACIVRTMPAGGRININSTLPNRLGKMLLPLHWYDYKKKYGKLDDFVADHPELFLIEGDYIRLREGAQEMIAATAAVAKVAAAAAAAPAPYSSFLPSIAVTPVAQLHRIKTKHPNGVNFGIAGGNSNAKLLSKSKDSQELNAPDFDRSILNGTQSRSSMDERPNSNFIGKQQGRLRH